ncbi:hypothetical protein ACFL15_01485 [Patescibacteria group bacterium]
MKKFIAFLISIFILFVFPFKVFAQEQNIVVEKGKIINENPFVIAGENVDISGIVNGDVIVGAGQINVSGKINGDLIAGGGNIRISGQVTQNVRLTGGQIIITGTVGKNILAATGNLEISESAIIGGYLVTGAGNLAIYAPIPGNLIAGSGNVSINNSIGGKVKLGSSQIYLSPEASVGGDFEYWSESEANIDENALITGDIIKHDLPQNYDFKMPNFDPVKVARGFFGFTLGIKIVSFLTLILIGFLMIKLFPKYMDTTSEIISKKGWVSLLVGFSTIFLFPIIFIVLLVTIIGIPVAFILAMIYSLFAYMAKIFVIYWLSGKIMDKKKSKYLSFFLASLVYSLVLIIPVFSRVARVLITFTGLGALLISCRQTLFKTK